MCYKNICIWDGMGDRESCSSRANFSCGWNDGGMQSLKFEVYNDILTRLRELNSPEVTVPDFEDELWVHFNRLPTRYFSECLET